MRCQVDNSAMPKQRRRTAQKLAIEEALSRVSRHITAEELHEVARHKLPRLSIGTVYRNLRRLVKEGKAQQVTGPDGRLLFESNKGPHHHLRCLSCNRVVDTNLGDDVVEAISRQTANSSGFAVKEVYVEVAGFCPICQGSLELEAAKKAAEAKKE